MTNFMVENQKSDLWAQLLVGENRCFGRNAAAEHPYRAPVCPTRAGSCGSRKSPFSASVWHTERSQPLAQLNSVGPTERAQDRVNFAIFKADKTPYSFL